MTDYPQQVTVPSSHNPAMFRITRGHHVQHVHFPLPVIRDLDALDEDAAREAAPAPDAAPSAAAGEGTAEADASADAPQ